MTEGQCADKSKNMHQAALPDKATAADEAAVEDDLLHFPASHPLSSRRVLVLNRNWQAVNIVDVRRAFALLFREDARVIDTDEGANSICDIEEWIERSLRKPPQRERDALHTVRFPIRIPSVMILDEYDRLPMKEPRLSREGIFARDTFTCQYCGREHSERDLNIDHVIPRERGGRNTWENLVTSCIACNERKANRLPHEAGMRLLRRPRRPARLPFSACVATDLRRSPDWELFLGTLR